MQVHPSYQQQRWIILLQNAAQVLVYALVISKLAISSLLLYYADVQPLHDITLLPFTSSSGTL